MENATLFRVLVLGLLGVTGCNALKIVNLTIPEYVKNGTEEPVVLDCEYTYNKGEEKKLVVKWFFEDDPNPVYQWIPEFDSKQHSEKFMVDEDYQVPSGNEYTRSRALSILRPTTDMSGRYSCQVQSLEGSDSAEDVMIVYATPSSVTANYTHLRGGGARVYCDVEGVYPLPDISLYQKEPGSIDEEPIDDVELESSLEDGAYDLRLFTEIPGKDLETDGLIYFGCDVVLNGTGYEGKSEVPYQPEPVAEKQEGDDTAEDNDALTARSSALVLLFSLLPLLFLLT